MDGSGYPGEHGVGGLQGRDLELAHRHLGDVDVKPLEGGLGGSFVENAFDDCLDARRERRLGDFLVTARIVTRRGFFSFSILFVADIALIVFARN